jgi:ATP-dependent Clp protease ATP-binding subunit ClpX
MVGYGASAVTQKVDKDNMMQYVTPQDLKAFGLIPEIIGRLPIITHLDPLGREALKRILTEPKNAITKQYQKLFKMDGVELVFSDEALDYIVDKAIEFNLGARGLRSLTESVMMDYMYETPTENIKNITITRKIAEEKISKANVK